jgi:hypothetical protein
MYLHHPYPGLRFRIPPQPVKQYLNGTYFIPCKRHRKYPYEYTAGKREEQPTGKDETAGDPGTRPSSYGSPGFTEDEEKMKTETVILDLPDVSISRPGNTTRAPAG